MRNDSQFKKKQFKKWCNWINTILDDIQTVYFHRSMYRGLSTLVAKYDQRDKNTLFFAFLQNIFVDSLSMGIRRQIKINKDSISLVRLLSELKEMPSFVTRKDYYDLWQKHDKGIDVFKARTFALFAAQDAHHIDGKIVEKDLLDLHDVCDRAVELADRRVAHRDKRGLEEDMTLQELLEELDFVGELVKKYYLLFTAKDIDLCPVPAELPWPRPWIDLFMKNT